MRRLAGHVSEGTLVSAGALIEVIGFGLVAFAASIGSAPLLLAALAVVVIGFSFMQPNLNSLLSRRSDPARQGMILGVGQSVNALARILGSALGFPLLRIHVTTPYSVAAVLMAVGLVMVAVAARRGEDYEESG